MRNWRWPTAHPVSVLKDRQRTTQRLEEVARSGYASGGSARLAYYASSNVNGPLAASRGYSNVASDSAGSCAYKETSGRNPLLFLVTLGFEDENTWPDGTL